MKRIAASILFVTVCILWILILPAVATDVDYDAVDEAAVPMVAQTELPQASDQFFRAHRQLLIYDHEQYSTSYDYDNLEGSLAANSVVLALTDEGLNEVRTWAGLVSGMSATALGYDVGTLKFELLANTYSSLASAWERIRAATSDFFDAFFWCLTSKASVCGFGFAAIVAGVGAAISLANPVAGGIVVAAAGILGGLIATICILIASYHFYNTLFFGGILLGAPGGRRFLRRLLRSEKPGAA